ncbi:MAG: hypothetical protein OXG04_08505 [Acidobacteria bacterium]|nr:hypothetical protein [Acidobacteriota bacterium]
MSKRPLLRYRLCGELGTETFTETLDTLFLRCFPTVTGELAAGLSADAQPNTQNDDWENGLRVTDTADAAIAAEWAAGNSSEAERLLLAIAHLRLRGGEAAERAVGIPQGMRRWLVSFDGKEPTKVSGKIEVWAEGEQAAIAAASEAARTAVLSSGTAQKQGEAG